MYSDIMLDAYKKKLLRQQAEKEKYDIVDCRNSKWYKIYSIRNDKTGFPHFLIYDENQWKWQSAKHFKPIN